MGLSYSLCKFTDCTSKPISVYRIFTSSASTNTPFAQDSCVESVLLNKRKTYNFTTIKSPPSGRHVVINDVGRHHK